MLEPVYGQSSQAKTNGRNAEPAIELQDGMRDDTPRFVAPPKESADIFRLLSELEDLVEKAPKKLGMMFGFDEDRFHMTVLKIRANLPEEMKRASKLARESERIVEESRSHADQIIQETRKQAVSEMERGKQDVAKIRETTQNELSAMKKSAQIEADRLKRDAEREAERLVNEANAKAARLVEEANLNVTQLIEAAKGKAAELVTENVIVQEAQLQAQEQLSRANSEARSVKHGADDYARDVLANLEGVLGKAIGQVQRGRELLEKA